VRQCLLNALTPRDTLILTDTWLVSYWMSLAPTINAFPEPRGQSNRKRAGSGLASTSKASKSVVSQVMERAVGMIARISATDMTNLSNPAVWTTLPFPCVHDHLPGDRFVLDQDGTFMFMGRLRVESVLEEIAKGGSPINIYGTKGYGKSHIIAAVVAQLMQNPETYVVFLPHARNLAKTPMTYLRSALCLAFVRDEEVLLRIASCNTVPELLAAVEVLDQFILVVDQMNSLEDDSKLRKEDKDVAYDIIGKLSDVGNCKLCVKGFSANNQTMIAYHETQTGERNLAFFGGFDGEEYRAWVEFQKSSLDVTKAADLDRDADMISTQLGRVPMYLTTLMTRVRGGTIYKAGVEMTVGPMTVKQAFRETSIELSNQITAVLDHFFFKDAKEKKLDVAECAVIGARPQALPKFWDHQYIFADPLSGCLRTVCFIVNDVLAVFLRERTDKDGKAGLLAKANISACIKCENPIERGCRAEAICVTAISHGFLPHGMIDASPGRIETTHFITADELVFDQSKRNPVVHYIPRAFNYEHIDSVLRVLTFGQGKNASMVKSAEVYVFQFTMQSVADHKRSLDFFLGDHEQWVKDLDAKVIRWHFVWILTSKECDKQIKGKQSLVNCRGVSRRKAGSIPPYTEWFFSFANIVPALKL